MSIRIVIGRKAPFCYDSLRHTPLVDFLVGVFLAIVPLLAFTTTAANCMQRRWYHEEVRHPRRCVVATSAFSGAPASAADNKMGALEIESPSSRAVPKGVKVAVGDMTIKDTGTEPDRLLSGATPVAGGFMVHEMTIDNGVMWQGCSDAELQRLSRSSRAPGFSTDHAALWVQAV
jgi:hypothetical protein